MTERVVYRALKRVGLRIAILAVLISIPFLDALHWLSSLVHRVLLALGLKRFDEWVKARPEWFAFVIVALMVCGSILFKVYSFSLVVKGKYALAAILSAAFKVVYMALFNYIAHIYGERLLKYWWIKVVYDFYESVRERIRRTKAFTTALRLKKKAGQYIRALRRRSLLAIARRHVRLRAQRPSPP